MGKGNRNFPKENTWFLPTQEQGSTCNSYSILKGRWGIHGARSINSIFWVYVQWWGLQVLHTCSWQNVSEIIFLLLYPVTIPFHSPKVHGNGLFLFRGISIRESQSVTPNPWHLSESPQEQITALKTWLFKLGHLHPFSGPCTEADRKSICLSRKGNFTKIFRYFRTQKAADILERNKVKETRWWPSGQKGHLSSWDFLSFVLKVFSCIKRPAVSGCAHI